MRNEKRSYKYLHASFRVRIHNKHHTQPLCNQTRRPLPPPHNVYTYYIAYASAIINKSYCVFGRRHKQGHYITGSFNYIGMQHWRGAKVTPCVSNSITPTLMSRKYTNIICFCISEQMSNSIRFEMQTKSDRALLNFRNLSFEPMLSYIRACRLVLLP